MHIGMTVNGGRGPRRRTTHAARPVPARGVRAHWHQDRLRHVVVRRVHGAGRRRVGEVVHDVRGPGRRRRRSPRSRASPPTASCTRCSRRSTSSTACSAASAPPGMVMATVSFLEENPNPTERDVRLGLEGNLCRCTGYHNIVKAVLAAAAEAAGVDPVTAVTDRARGQRTLPQGGSRRCSPERRASSTTSSFPARSHCGSSAAPSRTRTSPIDTTPPRRCRA